MKVHAVGIVIKDRWDETKQTLQSLSSCGQSKKTYDLFLVNNGSSEKTKSNLANLLPPLRLPIKHVYHIDEQPLSTAWNLFLHSSKEYEYRTKLDNDMVLPAKYHKLAFLDYMSKFAAQHSLDLCASFPLNKGFPEKFLLDLSRTARQGPGHLYGACMMINKKCFDTIGYFDERIARGVDIEYCHRAVKHGMRLDHVKGLYFTHIGKSTEGRESVLERYNEAQKILQNDRLRGFATSIWEKIV